MGAVDSEGEAIGVPPTPGWTKKSGSANRKIRERVTVAPTVAAWPGTRGADAQPSISPSQGRGLGVFKRCRSPLTTLMKAAHDAGMRLTSRG